MTKYKATLLFLFISIARNLFGQAPVITYPTPQVYPINKLITPLSPTNTGSPVPITPFVYGQVVTFSGGDFYLPSGIATDAAGNVYATDFGGSAVKKITPDGIVTTIANIHSPSGITIDASGNLFATDFDDNYIYKVTPGGVKSIFAGNGSSGNTDGPGANASFNGPGVITTDASGNMYLADQAGNKIRKITPAGIVSTVAGSDISGSANGTNATFNNPDGVAVDKRGNIYVADTKNNLIRKITSGGLVSTFAGSGVAGSNDGTGTTASFNYPTDVATDLSGNVFVADYKNNLIRKITPSGVVTSIAGNGNAGYSNGIGSLASFRGPIGMAFDPAGNLYVTDFANNVIRKITLTGYSIDKPLPAGLTFDSQTGIISGSPTAISPATDYTITAYNAGGSGSTIVNIRVMSDALITSVINFPLLSQILDSDNSVAPAATSNNTETPIVYTSDNPAVAIITANGLVHFIAPGIVHITATQAGNNHYNAATPVTQTVIVKEDQLILFSAIPAKTICDPDFTADAISSNPSIPLSYTSNNVNVATISSQGVIHITGYGTTIITVSQVGDDLYLPAIPQQQILTVKAPANPTVEVTPGVYGGCDGMSLTYTAVATNQGTNPFYQWQVNGINVGSNSTTFTSSTLRSGDKILCKVTNTTDCVSMPTAISNVASLQTVPYTTPEVTIKSSVNGYVCSGTAITFTATPVNGGTNPQYQWKINNTVVGSNSSTFTTSSLNDGDFVTCELTNQGGTCLTTLFATSNIIFAQITANQMPDVSVSASANNVYGGVPITFTATTTSGTSAGTTYQWQVNGLNTDSNSPSFTSNKLNEGDIVTCIVSGGTGCVVPGTSQPIIMHILAPKAIPIPNTFTPNSDGVNDSWNIPALAYYPNCVVNIFNRYGTKVYESKGYNHSWDGTINGKMLPVSTYYYVIDLGIGQQKLSGPVTIIR